MKVFISYAQSDLGAAQEIASALTKGKHDVWFDFEQVSPGENWAQKVAAGLEGADAIVRVISPEAMKSKWIRADIDYALTSSKYAGRLIPVMVKATKDFPWILRELNLIDATRKPATAGQQVLEALRQSKVGSR
jgi:hypothetical protein